jgi:hypothetical protein
MAVLLGVLAFTGHFHGGTRQSKNNTDADYVSDVHCIVKEQILKS